MTGLLLVVEVVVSRGTRPPLPPQSLPDPKQTLHGNVIGQIQLQVELEFKSPRTMPKSAHKFKVRGKLRLRLLRTVTSAIIHLQGDSILTVSVTLLRCSFSSS